MQFSQWDYFAIKGILIGTANKTALTRRVIKNNNTVFSTEIRQATENSLVELRRRFLNTQSDFLSFTDRVLSSCVLSTYACIWSRITWYFVHYSDIGARCKSKTGLVIMCSVPAGPIQIRRPCQETGLAAWPTVLVRTCRCTTRPVDNFLIVATGLGFATRPSCVFCIQLNLHKHGYCVFAFGCKC